MLLAATATLLLSPHMVNARRSGPLSISLVSGAAARHLLNGGPNNDGATCDATSLDAALPVAPNALACTCPDTCPYKTSTQSGCLKCGGSKPQCTNIYSGAAVPVLNRYSGVSVDGNLCSDWVNSDATYLTPMYESGDCSKTLYGALYGVYNCNTKQACFKATSCT